MDQTMYAWAEQSLFKIYFGYNVHLIVSVQTDPKYNQSTSNVMCIGDILFCQLFYILKYTRCGKYFFYCMCNKYFGVLRPFCKHSVSSKYSIYTILSVFFLCYLLLILCVQSNTKINTNNKET